ncbi:MAG TPA: four helix bundle protein [Gemmataceae bacterium]|jgi:hypothetical protein|nr:four helix bundle protein [Gemmataceae bacterium]
MAREIPVLLDFYDVSLDLSKRVLRFPRNLRYGLGLAIERRLQDVLALLVRAKYAATAEKSPVLRTVNVELEVLRFQVRQAAELGGLTANGHLHVLKGLETVGRQVGGWTKALPS